MICGLSGDYQVTDILPIFHHSTSGSLNNIEEACHNDFRSLEESVTSRFMSINVVIKDLQNRINQHYAVVQRSDFDQQSVSNESETNSSSSSSSSSGSSQKFANIISVIWE
ncbi:hypothetical protein RhiirC2_776678 [Rhizophagus irregularis]|uniref:Uncharacterized protein n=1 Tax=Rhizophagus irregularis TaxID=588596 RepID=A0A2N1NG78_9GLOM|nr:hypothetical protein RhiirC2_776678 [Rhizophagus irregularis]